MSELSFVSTQDHGHLTNNSTLYGMTSLNISNSLKCTYRFVKSPDWMKTHVSCRVWTVLPTSKLNRKTIILHDVELFTGYVFYDSIWYFNCFIEIFGNFLTFFWTIQSLAAIALNSLLQAVISAFLANQKIVSTSWEFAESEFEGQQQHDY